MATRPEPRRWSYAEFARLPSDDGRRYEVIAGELYVTPAPRTTHQHVCGQIYFTLREFIDRHDLGWVLPGPIDVLFAEGDYLEPDVVFVRRERRGIISERGIEGAPDLVVEVLSDSTAARDRGIKRQRYAHYGVPEYWVVDVGAGRIEVHRLREDPAGATVAAAMLEWMPIPGGPVLSIPVAEVLRGLE